jgi:predicted alpha/beta superfamily hydrolase
MFKKILQIILILTIFDCAEAAAFVKGVPSDNFESKIMGKARQYSVRLPASYAATDLQRYPVLYLLDGKANLSHTKGTVDYLAQTREMPEIIVVAIDTNNVDRTLDLTPSIDPDWPEPTGGGDKFLDFIEDELIPHIEANYKTAPFRMLVGHSFGGLLTMHSFTTRPQLFQAHFALSPSLHWLNNETTEKFRTLLKNNKNLKGFLYANIADEANYTSQGKRAQKAFDDVTALLKANAGTNLVWHMEKYPQETHGTIAVLGHFKGLRKLFNNWRLPYSQTTHGVEVVRGLYQKHSARLGYQLLPPKRIAKGSGIWFFN